MSREYTTLNSLLCMYVIAMEKEHLYKVKMISTSYLYQNITWDLEP